MSLGLGGIFVVPMLYIDAKSSGSTLFNWKSFIFQRNEKFISYVNFIYICIYIQLIFMYILNVYTKTLNCQWSLGILLFKKYRQGAGINEI